MKRKISIVLLSLLFIKYISGQSITKHFITSTPPPSNFYPAVEKESNYDSTILDVPAYIWSHGNVSTCIAMLAGYYDREGYPCIYTGSVNGGLAPLDNNSWERDSLLFLDNPFCYYLNYKNSISASIIDFHSDASKVNGDNLIRNQSRLDYSFVYSTKNDGSRLYDYSLCEEILDQDKSVDIIHKLKEYFEEGTGYTVNNVFSQLIQNYNGNKSGFTFQDFMNEIDQKRPVLVNFSGQTSVGISYDAQDSTIIIYNTWSITKTKIKWGMPLIINGIVHEMQSVIVLELLGNYQNFKGEILKSICDNNNGPFDKVIIKAPPIFHFNKTSIAPKNTYQFPLGGNISFFANFNSFYSNTRPLSWSWKIELYYYGGTYQYIQDNFITSSIDCYWTTKVPGSLPDYNWIIENGAISGKVTVIVTTTDNNSKNDEVRIHLINNNQTILFPNEK